MFVKVKRPETVLSKDRQRAAVCAAARKYGGPHHFRRAGKGAEPGVRSMRWTAATTAKATARPFLDYGEMAEDVARVYCSPGAGKGRCSRLDGGSSACYGWPVPGPLGETGGERRHPDWWGSVLPLRAALSWRTPAAAKSWSSYHPAPHHTGHAETHQDADPGAGGRGKTQTERETRALAAHISRGKLMILPGEGTAATWCTATSRGRGHGAFFAGGMKG